MTIEQMKDEAITMLRGALKKVLAANLAQVAEIQSILELTDPSRREANRNVETIRRHGIG